MGPACGVVRVAVLTFCLMIHVAVARLDIGPGGKWHDCIQGNLMQYCKKNMRPKNTCGTASHCDVCKIDAAADVRETGYAICTKMDVCMPRLPAYVQVLKLRFNGRGNKLSRTMLQNVTEVPITSLILKDGAGVENGSLKHMEHMECVNLDFTDVDMETLIEVLNLPRLKKLSLRDSGLLYSMLRNNNVFNSTINYLWLSNNGLRQQRTDQNFTDLFRGFPNLKGLDLHNTNICHVKGTHTFKSLETLDLSDNSVIYFSPCRKEKDGDGLPVGSYFPKLVNLDLSMNKLKSFRQADAYSFCFPSLRYLNLSGNYITKVHAPSYFNSVTFPALEYLNLNSQLSKTLQVDVNILRHPTLMELRLNNLQIAFHEGEVVFSTNVTHLKSVYLEGSNLNLEDEERLLAIFGHLRSLKTLSLSGSKLGFVSCRAVSNWIKLKKLNLSDNAISSIPEQCFDSLPYLTHLDLSSNKLTTVSPLTFGETLRAHLKFLYLGRNPFVCSCELFWFMQWFLSDHRLFKTSDPKYMCRIKHETVQLGQFTLTKQACLLTHDVSVLVIFSCSFIIAVLTAVTLLYCYRWHLRLLLYEAFRGRDDVRRRYLQQGHFAYDVFVSFDSENMPWVHQRLMPELEGRLGLRLCVHVRDFIPGRNIVDNIVECVESSKKVLMLFSNHFVLSQWCQFELNLCIRHIMDCHDALIVACLDDVVSREMTPSMIAVLKTTTYLQWEEHGDAARAFWGRLTQALNEVMQHEEQAM